MGGKVAVGIIVAGLVMAAVGIILYQVTADSDGLNAIKASQKDHDADIDFLRRNAEETRRQLNGMHDAIKILSDKVDTGLNRKQEPLPVVIKDPIRFYPIKKAKDPKVLPKLTPLPSKSKVSER